MAMCAWPRDSVPLSLATWAVSLGIEGEEPDTPRRPTSLP